MVDQEARPHGVVRTGLLSMVALAALGLTRLVHGSLVSRATDPQTYGRVGALIALTTIASLLLPAGVASATAKFVPYLSGSGDPVAARTAYHLLSRLGVAGSVLFGLGAGGAAALLFNLTGGEIAQVAALAITFSLYSIDKATLYGYQRITAYVRLELCTSALAVLATVLVVVAGWTAYLVPLALAYGVFSVVARWLVRGEVHGPTGGLGVVPRGEILGFVALACLGTLSSQGFLQGTQLLAVHFATPAEVGYFAAAVTLVTPMYFLPRALGLALFPTMARAHGAGDLATVRKQADVSTRALLVVLAPVFAVGILLAREVLVLFGRQAYAAGAPVLQLMLAATFLAVCAVATVNALSSGDRRQVRTPVAAALTGCLTGLATVAVLGGPLGAAGVGIGYLAGTAVTSAGPAVAVWRQHRMAWRTPALRALVVVGGALAIAWALRGLDLSRGARVLVDVAVAAVAGLVSVGFLVGQMRAVLRDARAPV
ncbi:MAG TPA: lipopolysaccharide biosynthesis protein [Micromonosporaceae bacterium]|nr:lipopolysaccharide biosynthesis protein [Micromonosporaceae bacterium]